MRGNEDGQSDRRGVTTMEGDGESEGGEKGGEDEVRGFEK